MPIPDTNYGIKTDEMERMSDTFGEILSHHECFTDDSRSKWNMRKDGRFFNVPDCDYAYALSKLTPSDQGYFERMEDDAPLYFTFKFRFADFPKEATFNDNFAIDMVCRLHKLLESSVAPVLPGGEEMSTIVTTSPTTFNPEGYFESPISVWMPKYCMSKRLLLDEILPTYYMGLQSNLVFENNLKANTPLNDLQSPRDIIDLSIYEGGVPMKYAGDGYKVIYYTSGKYDQRRPQAAKSFWDTFKPTEHSLSHYMDDRVGAFTQDPCMRWFHVVTSTKYSPHKISVPECRRHTTHEYILDEFGTAEVDYIRQDSRIVYALFDMWNPKRLEDVYEWKCLGEAVYNAYRGDMIGVDRWLDLTKRAIEKLGYTPDLLKNNHKEGRLRDRCMKEYFKFPSKRITVRTVAWIASEDNDAAYSEWNWNWYNPAFQLAVETGLHTDIATAMYRTNWLRFSCDNSGKSSKWYFFENDRLHEDNGTRLLRNMSTEFVAFLQTMKKTIIRQTDPRTNNNPRDQELAEGIIERIHSLIAKMKTSAFKRSIESECKEIFDNFNVEEYMDTNPEIMGLKNGVLIVTRLGCKHRHGRPEDYITKSMGAGYYPELINEKSELVKKVYEWFEKVFVDAPLRKDFMKWIASLLRGGNIDKQLRILTGCGNNSKTMIISALEKLFKDYAGTIPVQAFGGSRTDPNGPSPAWARIDGMRVIFSSEPEGDMKLKASILNMITGNGRFYARKMKKNGKDIKPMCKIAIDCNTIPEILGAGKATRNRVRVTPFASTFVHHPPDTLEEQFKQKMFLADPDFDFTIDDLVTALLWVIIDTYPIYLAEGLIDTPEEALKATNKYWRDSDTYYQFISEKLCGVKVNGVKDTTRTITAQEMYNVFKPWHKDNNPSSKPPEKQVVIRELISRIGALVNDNHWEGISFRMSSGGLNDKNSLLGGGIPQPGEAVKKDDGVQMYDLFCENFFAIDVNERHDKKEEEEEDEEEYEQQPQPPQYVLNIIEPQIPGDEDEEDEEGLTGDDEEEQPFEMNPYMNHFGVPQYPQQTTCREEYSNEGSVEIDMEAYANHFNQMPTDIHAINMID